MSELKENEGFIELYDVTKNRSLAKAPIAKVRFIPRVGERIFVSIGGPGDWSSFTVVQVEYFLGYSSEPQSVVDEGMNRISLYVEPSK